MNFDLYFWRGIKKQEKKANKCWQSFLREYLNKVSPFITATITRIEIFINSVIYIPLDINYH